MPLDGHSFLVAQGWTGTGTGLRQGSLSRPLAIPQKKNLAGVGKDRDEAFPFWDHLFSAAASAIQVKLSADDDDDDSSSGDNGSAPTPNPEFLRTKTGILSNRRPPTGTPAATSGTSTPSTSSTPGPGPSTSRLTLIALAKREAARRNLYSRFFKGPVLGPDAAIEVEIVKSEIKGGEQVQVQVMDHAITRIGGTEGKEESKKRKRKGDKVEVEDSEGVKSEVMDEETQRKERRQRKAEKRQLKERKRARKEEKRRRKEEKAMAAAKAEGEAEANLVVVTEHEVVAEQASGEEALTKDERRRRRKEKRAQKELAQEPSANAPEVPRARKAKTSKRGAEESGSPLDNGEQGLVVGIGGVAESVRRKKKRKVSDAT